MELINYILIGLLFIISGIIFISIYNKKGSIKEALLGSLIFGKVYVIVLYIFKIDRVLFKVNIYNKKTGDIKVFEITANMLILFFFLLTFILIILLKHLEEQNIKLFGGVK